MSYDELLKEYNSLPLDYKKEVEDFIGYLVQKLKRQPAEEKPQKRTLGFAKGKLWMSNDFDEPLEDMKEYM